jgi:hypothetical protein
MHNQRNAQNFRSIPMKTLVALVSIVLAIAIPAAARAQSAQVKQTAAVATPAAAQTADRPQISVGESWDYSFRDSRNSRTDCTYALTVTAVTADTISIDMQNPRHCNIGALAESTVYDKDFNLMYAGMTPYRTNAFPLAVGKQWSQQFAYNTEANTPVHNDVTAKVVAIEKVTVPAGIFDAYKVVVERKYQSQYVSGTITETRWYAPQAKNYVRRISVDSASASNTLVSELTNYHHAR